MNTRHQFPASGKMPLLLAALAAIAASATLPARAATTHSTSETIAEISGDNVFNGAGATITFETTKDTTASGWLSVEGNGNNPVVFQGKDDSDDYGYIITGETYVSGGGGSGSLKIKSGTYTFKNTLNIGQNANNTSYLFVDGGVFDYTATQMNFGQSTTTTSHLTQTGGRIEGKTLYISPGSGAYAEMTFSGGSFTNSGNVVFGYNVPGGDAAEKTAEVAIAGDADVAWTGEVWLRNVDKRNDTINLNGGTLSVNVFKTNAKESSTGTIAFNGGTLKAHNSHTAFIPAGYTITVGENGGTLDTNGKAIGIASAIGGEGTLTITGGLAARKKGANLAARRFCPR